MIDGHRETGYETVAYPCGCEIHRDLESKQTVTVLTEEGAENVPQFALCFHFCSSHELLNMLNNRGLTLCFPSFPPTYEELNEAVKTARDEERRLARMNKAHLN